MLLGLFLATLIEVLNLQKTQ